MRISSAGKRGTAMRRPGERRRLGDRAPRLDACGTDISRLPTRQCVNVSYRKSRSQWANRGVLFSGASLKFCGHLFRFSCEVKAFDWIEEKGQRASNRLRG